MRTFKICFSCKKTNITAPTLTFYSIPVNTIKRLRWCEALSFNPNSLPKQCFVCNDHFEDDDFIYTDKGLKFLKPGAVPRKLTTGEIKIENQSNPVPLNEDEMGNTLEYSYEDLEFDQLGSEVFRNTSSKIRRKKSICRACKEATDNGLPVYLSCFRSYTIKDSLIQLMPELIPILMDKDIVCRTCFKIIKKTLIFLANCLRVNNVTNSLENTSEKQKSSVAGRVDGEESICRRESNNDGKCKTDLLSIENDLTVISLRNGVEGQAKAEQLTKVFKDVGIPVHNQSKATNSRKRILLIGKEDVWQCPICDENFPSEPLRQMHFTTCHKLSKAHILTPKHYHYNYNMYDAKQQCAVCNVTFDSARMLQAHAKRCTMFCCSYCNIFVSANGLSKHTREEHNDAKPFKCFSCYKQFANFHVYQKHNHNILKKILHRYDGVWKTCKICHKRVDCLKYREHFNSHKIFKCEFCQKKFTNTISLQNHQKQHTEKKSLCPFCGKIFNMTEINIHIKTIHNNNKVRSGNASCDVCSHTFSTDANLEQHIKTVHKCVPVACKICNQKFSGVKSLKSHTSWKHNEYHKNVCFLCMTKFSTFSCLNRHIIKAHGECNLDISSHRCRYCMRQYQFKSELLKHEKTHRNQENRNNKSYLGCPWCDRRFSRIEALQMHAKEKHDGTIISTPKNTNKQPKGKSFTEEGVIDSAQVEDHYVATDNIEDQDVIIVEGSL